MVGEKKREKERNWKKKEERKDQRISPDNSKEKVSVLIHIYPPVKEQLIIGAWKETKPALRIQIPNEATCVPTLHKCL